MIKKLMPSLLLIFISSVIFSYSALNISLWKKDSNKTNEIIKNIYSELEVVDDTEDIINSEKDEKEETQKTNQYQEYNKMNYIDINIDDLQKINRDTVGWLKVEGTNINYPFVHTKNNDYYLTHSFDKTKNEAGWVFLDYRNDINNLSKNTIIYAHSRLDGTMFGTLKKVFDKSWFNNKNNHYIKVSTEKENLIYQVFSVYHIKTTNDYIQTEFASKESYLNWLSKIRKRSMYNFNIKLSSEDKVLTLSTCYKNDEKAVIHAKLLKTISK